MSDILKFGNVAVITGAASGIGLATAKLFASKGMRIVMADMSTDLDAAAASVEGETLAFPTDVSAPDAGNALADATFSTFGRTDVLMNNDAARVSGGADESLASWHHTMAVNFWGAVHGERAFLPRMISQNTPAAIVNTGSKQGVTNPPGNTIDIICLDNEITTEMDNKRILWSAADITENRPPLSRWHKDWQDKFR